MGDKGVSPRTLVLALFPTFILTFRHCGYNLSPSLLSLTQPTAGCLLICSSWCLYPTFFPVKYTHNCPFYTCSYRVLRLSLAVFLQPVLLHAISFTALHSLSRYTFPQFLW